MNRLKTIAAAIGFFLLPVVGLAAYGGVTWGFDAATGSLAVNISGVWYEVGLLSGGAVSPPRTVATNALLKAVSLSGKSAGYKIVRQGFTTASDGGELGYSLSLSACSISGGNNFTQVSPTVGTGCWLAEPASLAQGYDIRAAGLTAGDSGTYSSANAAAFAKVWALTGETLIIIPEGLTFRLVCGTQYSASGSLKFLGTGTGGTIKFDTGCSFTGSDVFGWNGKNNAGSTNVTWDLNSPNIPAATVSIHGCKAYSANMSGCVFERNRMLGGTDKMFQLSGAATAGRELSGFVAKDNYFELASGTLQNHCILLTTGDNAGTIPDANIEHNTCVGSTIQLDGARTRAVGNDVSGFEFGNGIFSAYSSTSTPSNTDCYIADNIIHDTGAGLDSNSTPHSGMENNCYNSVTKDNQFNNLGGEAISSFTGLAYYYNNTARGVGKGYDGTTSHRAAWVANTSAQPTATSAHTVWIGNVSIDDGTSNGGSPDTPAQLWCFIANGGITGVMEGRNNQCDISTKVDASGHLLAARFGIGGGGGGVNLSVDPQLINFSQTIQASAVSAMTWAPLDTSLKNYYLNCRNIYPPAADTGQLQVSEDGGGTWKTSGNYVSTGQKIVNGTSSAFLLTTETGMKLGNETWDSTQGKHAQFQVHCRDFGGSVAKKDCVYFDVSARVGSGGSAGSNLQINGSAYWNGDAGAIDGLRFNMNGGQNESGVCTLRGEL